MPEVVLGVGSNTRPEAAFRATHAALEKEFGVVRWSSVYRGAAQGAAAADYLNAVVVFATRMTPLELRAWLEAIEERCGRTRLDPAVVALDLDVLFYGRRVDAEQRLPRPGAFSQPFVLVPLAELVPTLAHPVLGTMAAAAAQDLRAGAVARVGRLQDL